MLDTWLGLMNEDVILAVGESRTFSHDGEPLSGEPEETALRSLRADKAIGELLYHTPKHGICDKFFRRTIVQQQQLRFREDIFNFEDLLFVISYLSGALQGQGSCSALGSSTTMLSHTIPQRARRSKKNTSLTSGLLQGLNASCYGRRNAITTSYF